MRITYITRPECAYRFCSPPSCHQSHATPGDHGAMSHCPIPVRSPITGSLQAPLCPPSRPIPRRYTTHQNRRGDAMDEGVGGWELGVLPHRPARPRHPAPPPPSAAPPPTPGAPGSPTLIPHFRRHPLPEVALAFLHPCRRGSPAPPAHIRSRTVHRLFHLPVSFRTSPHRIFCCIFHSGHTLKRSTLVCEGTGTTSTGRWGES